MADTTAMAPDDMGLVNIDSILNSNFQLECITDQSMALIVWRTIRALQDDLDATDLATAKLALEVAERIDGDGKECGISLYNRLHSLILDLQHNERKPRCPLSQQPANAE